MAQAAQKIEPKGELLPISQIAKRMKLDRSTCRSRLDDLGYEPDDSSTAKNQLFWFDDEVEFAIKTAKDSFSAAKIRDFRATYQIKELKLAKDRGELVKRTEMTVVVQSVVTSMYQEYTIRSPKRIAAKLAKAKTAIDVKKILQAENTRIMKMLKSNFQAFIDQK